MKSHSLKLIAPTLLAFGSAAFAESPDLKRVVEATRNAAREEKNLEATSDAIAQGISKNPNYEKIQKALQQAQDGHDTYWNYVMKFNAEREAQAFEGEDQGNYYLTESYLENLAALPKAKISLIQAFTGLKAIPGQNPGDAWTTTDLGVGKNLEGQYQDFRGGDLNISKSGSALKITISVVRGPTAHTGDIEGTLQKTQAASKYTLSVKNSSNKPCILVLSRNEMNHLNVRTTTPESCQEFHGARAYFDGSFYKTPATWNRE